MVRNVRAALTRLGVFNSHPAAFVIVVCYVGLWLAFNLTTLNWHAVATIATWFMTLIIQRCRASAYAGNPCQARRTVEGRGRGSQ
jgi:hypothetical protein